MVCGAGRRHGRWLMAAGARVGDEGQACLLPLGQVLGRCGWEEEQRALDCAARRLEQEADRAREERRRMGRVYEALGLSGGAFLVILLL